ncbi:AAA family ATPase [Prevotella melaninogenica]|uniref:AAA family ATPase n=1 Tax=Prevotella melaninogenica TaxID=28132 RepID=UPI001BA76E9A|nr:AAA family ATPase [Prevotella melaninogenica]QUB68489.1 AAA family ATPase [Prevotella melaninogenica]
MRSFRIESIYISDNCDKTYCKILKKGYEYKFYSNKITEDINLYGDNINICALVGKNGSGKSSLLDMLYRIVNNFGYLLFRGTIMPGAENPIFLKGIYASVKFRYGDETFELKCEDKRISLYSNEIESIWNDEYNGENIKCEEAGNNKVTYDTGINSDKEDIINVAKKFFFTIVTNYSIQSLNYEDYEEEGPWIQKLFHKNDGYSLPIVLNPYRHEYGIDTEIEAELTNSRLSAIFLNSTEEKPFLDGYNLNRLEYRFAPFKYYRIIYAAYRHWAINEQKEDIYLDLENDDEIMSFIEERFIEAYKTKGSYVNLILKGIDGLRLNLSQESPDSYKAACVYIVYKVLSSTKYPDYAQYFQSLHRFEHCISCEVVNEDVKEYIKKLIKDESHIAKKLHQTIEFVNNYDNIKKRVGQCLDVTNCSFNFNTYLESNKLPNNISEIIKKLPPPIYKVQIFLNRSREKNDERSQTDEILFSRLSSGEKQFAYMMSTYIYHLANLESIHIASKLTPMPLQRVAYSMINMIFDEMELCFHPEYQRTFVNNLVSYIKRAGLNKVFSFNVILTTHSPFILSDIPACNILALKDGMPDDSFKNERTFAGNIYDILGNNFFMENFIGEFASKEIDRIISRLTNGKWISEKGRPIIKSKIDIIGDDVIRIKLLEKLGDGDDIRERVKILNAELKEYNDI